MGNLPQAGLRLSEKSAESHIYWISDEQFEVMAIRKLSAKVAV
jgi:hypothetical protein